MSESMKERIAADLQKAKAEGGERAARIGGIIRQAAAQTVTEFKQGSTEVRAIAKDALASVVENLSEKTEPGTEASSEPPASVSWKVLVVKLVTTVKNRLFASWNREYTQLHNQYSGLKERAINLDQTLTDRYGDGYAAVKQRLDKVATWYKQSTAEADALGVDALQQRQEEFGTKVGEAGASLAKKEKQIRQQVKEFLQTTAAKL